MTPEVLSRRLFSASVMKKLRVVSDRPQLFEIFVTESAQGRGEAGAGGWATSRGERRCQRGGESGLTRT
jgi:hypothetical protein